MIQFLGAWIAAAMLAEQTLPPVQPLPQQIRAEAAPLPVVALLPAGVRTAAAQSVEPVQQSAPRATVPFSIPKAGDHSNELPIMGLSNLNFANPVADSAARPFTQHVATRLADSAATQPLRGTVYIGGSELSSTPGERGALGVAVDVAGRMNTETQVGVSFVRGPVDIVTALAASALYGATVRASVKRPTWNAVAGDLVSVQHVLSGAGTRADGLAIRVKNRVVADLTVGRPKFFGGGGGGEMVHGRFGLVVPGGTVALLASHLSRPQRLSSLIVGVRDVEPQSETEVSDLENIARLFSRESRVRGAGLESDLRFGSHTVLARTGVIDLASHSGVKNRGAAAEIRYSFTQRRATLSAYLRRTPTGVPGTYVGGDTASATTRLPIGRGFNVVASGYSNSTALLAQPQEIRSDGASAGIQHRRGPVQFTARGNYQELRSSIPALTRSVSASVAVPARVVSVDLHAEIGETWRRGRAWPLRRYRGRINVGGDTSVWLMASHTDRGFQRARTSANLGGSIPLGSSGVFDAGVSYGKGQLLGDTFGAWTSIEAPLGRALTFIGAIDYLRWDYNASPFLVFLMDEEMGSPWRFTIGVRHKFSLPFPRPDER